MASINNNNNGSATLNATTTLNAVDDEWSSFILNTSKYNGTESDTESDIDEVCMKPEFINDKKCSGSSSSGLKSYALRNPI
jgi:hypothetical protein